jgi:hypothetical protein
MSELFTEMVATLQDARQTVSHELEALSRAPYLDTRSLVVLDQSLRTFAGQADALVALMAKTGAADDQVAVAKVLLGFFRSARERITAMLVVGRQ